MNYFKKYRRILNANLFAAIIVIHLEPLPLFQHVLRHLYLTLLISGIMYLFPYLMSLTKSLLFRKKQFTAPKSEIDDDQQIWRMLCCNVTKSLKEMYPNATWQFIDRPTLQDVLDGKSILIRTQVCGQYDFAEFHLTQSGDLSIKMVCLVTFEEQPEQTIVKDKEKDKIIDIEGWYSLIGQPLLMDLIIDLNARGFQELFINELGEVYIKKEKHPEVKGVFPHFPCKEYWSALIDIFAEDELTAMQCGDILKLSWK